MGSFGTDLVTAYTEYTDYSETDVVEFYLNFIREDVNFRDWVIKRRNNKKLPLFRLKTPFHRRTLVKGIKITLAQRLGITDKRVKIEDILYLR
jgi:hypothetical protein